MLENGGGGAVVAIIKKKIEKDLESNKGWLQCR